MSLSISLFVYLSFYVSYLLFIFACLLQCFLSILKTQPNLILYFCFLADPLYPNYFKIRNVIVPTGTSNVPIDGSWLKRSEPSQECDPELQGGDGGEECFFKPDPNQVRIVYNRLGKVKLGLTR